MYSPAHKFTILFKQLLHVLDYQWQEVYLLNSRKHQLDLDPYISERKLGILHIEKLSYL